MYNPPFRLNVYTVVAYTVVEDRLLQTERTKGSGGACNETTRHALQDKAGSTTLKRMCHVFSSGAAFAGLGHSLFRQLLHLLCRHILLVSNSAF